MSQFTLSTLDRGAPHTYIRYAMTFACNAEQAATAIEKLHKATKRLVSEIPMLAGVVTTNDSKNPVVAVTIDQVNNFKATIARPQVDDKNYTFVRNHGFAPRYISSAGYTPLTDGFIGDTNACCAIQANLIDGGLVLAIYLHHAVADIRGVATIVRLMSEGLPARELSEESLELEATTVSQARARLSSGNGMSTFLATARGTEQQRQLSAGEAGPQGDHNTPAGGSVGLGKDAATTCAAILRFRLNIIVEAAEMINNRRSLRDSNNTDKVTPREVLIAIVRARWANGTQVTSRSCVSFAVDIRPHLVPALEPHWMGNAEATAVAIDETTILRGGYDLSFIERTANIIHMSAKSASSDPLTRSHIEMINKSTSVPSPPETQLVVHDWAPVSEMPEQEMDVGLGLGPPNATRRIGRSFGTNDMMLMPEDHQAQAWDVQVEVRGDWMSMIQRDEELGKFLWNIAL